MLSDAVERCRVTRRSAAARVESIRAASYARTPLVRNPLPRPSSPQPGRGSRRISGQAEQYPRRTRAGSERPRLLPREAFRQRPSERSDEQHWMGSARARPGPADGNPSCGAHERRMSVNAGWTRVAPAGDARATRDPRRLGARLVADGRLLAHSTPPLPPRAGMVNPAADGITSERPRRPRADGRGAGVARVLDSRHPSTSAPSSGSK
jgi:hypothetical protein